MLWKVSLAPFCTIVKNDATHEMGSTDSEGLDSTAACTAAFEVTFCISLLIPTFAARVILEKFPYTRLLSGSPFLGTDHLPLARFCFWFWF